MRADHAAEAGLSETASPTLATVLRAAVKAQLSQARVALPARVESYDASTQQATVQPLIYEGYQDETGERQAERLPVVTGVPVVFPGSGGFRVTFPVAVGDTVLLVFASSSIDRWLALGGEVDPIDDRRHNISDAIAIPGLHSFASPLANAPTSTMSLGNDNGGPTIEISATDIQVGGSSPLVLRSEFLSHTHATAGTGTPSPPIVGGSSTPPTVFPGTGVLKGG